MEVKKPANGKQSMQSIITEKVPDSISSQLAAQGLRDIDRNTSHMSVTDPDRPRMLMIPESPLIMLRGGEEEEEEKKTHAYLKAHKRNQKNMTELTLQHQVISPKNIHMTNPIEQLKSERDEQWRASRLKSKMSQ